MARDMSPEVDTATVSSPEMVRARWIAELRRQGDRQCVGEFQDQRGNVCALGLLGEVVGIRPNDFHHMKAHEIGAFVGMTVEQIQKVPDLNDDKKLTFAEIAHVVEGWFK